VKHGKQQQRSLWLRIWNSARLVITLGLVAYLVIQANPLAILEAWRNADLRLLALAFGLQLVGIALSAAKWGVILGARQQQQPYPWLLGTYLAGQFANNFLPTTVGGDALRAVQLGRRIGSFSQASASIFLERLTGFLALSMIAVLAMGVSYVQVTGAPLVTDLWLRLVTVGFALLAIIAAVVSFAAPLLLQIFGRYLPKVTHGPLEKIASALSAYFPQGRRLALVIVMSLLFQSIWIVIHIIAGRALGIEAPLLLFALMVPLTDILGLLPIFVNNLGARELVFATYLSQVGVMDATALALSFMIFSIRLVASLLGGLVVLFGGADLRAARAYNKEGQSAPEPPLDATREATPETVSSES
jgi:hypothetical protein